MSSFRNRSYYRGYSLHYERKQGALFYGSFLPGDAADYKSERIRVSKGFYSLPECLDALKAAIDEREDSVNWTEWFLYKRKPTNA